MIQNTAPAAIVQPAEPLSPFILSLRAHSDRIQNARDKAREMGVTLGNFPSDYEIARVEKAYADFQAEYHAWLDSRCAEIDADLDAAEASGVTLVEEVAV